MYVHKKIIIIKIEVFELARHFISVMKKMLNYIYFFMSKCKLENDFVQNYPMKLNRGVEASFTETISRMRLLLYLADKPHFVAKM